MPLEVNPEDFPEPLAGLVREHREIEEVVANARDHITQSFSNPDDAALAEAAIEHLRDLEAYVAIDLTVHIAKEEDVLFPVLRGLDSDMDLAIVDMFVQHDTVRERHASLQRLLANLDHNHDDVRNEHEALSNGLAAAANGGITVELISNLREIVTRLDWILQGHFGDEEDGVFFPSLDLLSPEAFTAMSVDMAALEAEFA